MPYIPSGTELLSPFQVLERAGLREGMSVADLGCGAIGHFVFPAAKMVGKSGVVYAVDILKSVLSAIESRARLEGANNIRTLWSDIEIVGATAIPPGSMDLTMVVNNLPKQGMISEAATLTKPGGIVLVVDWKPTAAPFGPPSKDRVDKEAVKAMAASEKLNLREEFDAGQYHYGLIFVK